MATIPNPDDYIGWSQLPTGGFGGSFNGYGASGSWGDPVTTSTSNTSSSSNSGATTSATKQNGGWYWNPATGKSEQYWAPGSGPTQTSSTPSNTDVNASIDSIFSPLNQSLSNYQESLRAQTPIAIEEANNAAAAQEASYDQSLLDYATNRDNAQNTLNKTFLSAYSQAKRDAQAAYQKAQSRYGGGSSLGEGIKEIIGQEFMRGTGQQRQTLQEGIAQAFQYYNSAARFVNDKKIEIKKLLQTEIKKIGALADEQYAQIEMQKAQNESAKQSARNEVLQQALANSNSLQQQASAAALELKIWQEQLNATLQANLVQNAQQNILTVPQIQNVAMSGFGGTSVPSSISPVTYTNKTTENNALSDTQQAAFNQLFNPFAGN